MVHLAEQIMELNQDYKELGEDLVLLEAVLQTAWEECDLPQEYIASTLHRITDYMQQHTKAISHFTQFFTEDL